MRETHYRRVILLCVVLATGVIGPAVIVVAQAEAPELDEVVAGLRDREAALGSISFHCVAETTRSIAALVEHSIARARQGPGAMGQQFRDSVSELWAVLQGPNRKLSLRLAPDQPLSVICRTPDIVTSIAPQPIHQTPFIGSIAPVSPAAGEGPEMDDVALWTNGFFVSPMRGLPWSECVRSPDWMLADDAWNGEAAVRLERREMNGTTERYWLVPGRDWSVARWELALEPPALFAVMEVEEWEHVDGTVWLATVWRREEFFPYGEGEEPEVASQTTVRVGDVDLAPEINEAVFTPDLRKDLPAGSEIHDFRLGGIAYWIGDPATPERMDVVADYVRTMAEAGADTEFRVPTDLWQYRGAAGRESSRCGPECLSLLLRLRGVRAEADDLAQETGWTPTGGTTFAGLAEGARRLGVPLKGVSLGYQDLLQLGEPAIVPLNYGHFILFIAERDGKVYFVEPPDVVQSMKPEEFAKLWTGEALVFEDRVTQ